MSERASECAYPLVHMYLIALKVQFKICECNVTGPDVFLQSNLNCLSSQENVSASCAESFWSCSITK